MTVIDWVFLAIVILLAARCFVRGFVEELLSVAAIAGGILVALLLYRKGAELVRTQLKIQAFPEVLAFIVIFLVAFLVVKLIEHMIREGLEATNLENADRVLGLFLGAIEGMILVALILVALKLQPLFNVDKLLQNSLFAKTLLPIVGPEVAQATRGLKIQAPPGLLKLQPPVTKP
ncbi:MAG TPA: CvpA family protein [Rectinemataceae bacterium]|nr:CvpA family protein [Rectinemataceae bacterium]